MKTDRQVLEDAIRLLEREDGWCKGTWVKYGEESRQMSFCAEGAIRQAAGLFSGGVMGEGRIRFQQARRIDRAVAIRMGTNSPAVFNDRASTTKEDVILCMKQALQDVEG